MWPMSDDVFCFAMERGGVKHKGRSDVLHAMRQSSGDGGERACTRWMLEIYPQGCGHMFVWSIVTSVSIIHCARLIGPRKEGLKKYWLRMRLFFLSNYSTGANGGNVSSIRFV